MQIFQIVRWKNLVMIAFVQGLVKYFLLPLFTIADVLSDLQFLLFVLACVFIMAGGYIVNDITDLEMDRINKPSKLWIPEYLDLRKAKFLYFIITLLGLSFGLVFSVVTESSVGFVLFLLPAILLYLYAIRLKKVLILANILVSFMIVFSLLILVYFEKVPLRLNELGQLTITSVLISLVYFAFLMNLLREIVKDVEDKEGDMSSGVVSIAIQFGVGKTKLVISVLIGLLIVSISFVSLVLYKHQVLLVVYLVFVVLGSLIFFLSRLNSAKNKTDFGQLSSYLKLIMILGMLAVFLIQPV